MENGEFYKSKANFGIPTLWCFFHEAGIAGFCCTFMGQFTTVIESLARVDVVRQLALLFFSEDHSAC